MTLLRARDAGDLGFRDLGADQAAEQIVVAHPEHRIMVGVIVGAPLGSERLAPGDEVELAGVDQRPVQIPENGPRMR
ncbi:hypothetical protein WME94_25265 [Sorangium sp. So ce429]